MCGGGGLNYRMEGGIKLGLKNRKAHTAGAFRCVLHNSRRGIKIVVYLYQNGFFLGTRQKRHAWELAVAQAAAGRAACLDPTGEVGICPNVLHVSLSDLASS